MNMRENTRSFSVDGRRRLWTCIIDFRGGTYLQQVWAPAAREVLPAALAQIEVGDIPDLDARALSALREDASGGGDPVMVEGMVAVYCVDASAGDAFLIAHIIETVAPS